MVEMGVWPVTLLVLVVWCMWDGVGGAHWQKEVRMGYVSQFVEEYATSKRWPAALASTFLDCIRASVTARSTPADFPKGQVQPFRFT